MKKLLLTAAAILATLNMYAQGTGSGIVNYNTTGVTQDRRIWVNTTGVAGEGTLAGAGYVTALYWGPAGSTDDAQFTQVGPTANFLTGTAAGTFFGSGRTITGLSANGITVALQSRAWAGAAGSTWDSAVERGKGPVFDLKLKDPSNALETAPTIGQAAGWAGYAIVVPEPSAIALGILGAGALLMLRRRK